MNGDPNGVRVADVVSLFGDGASGPVPGFRHRLPLYVDTFLGRSRESDELVDLVASRRLVTITGAGGVGKTRLAVEVARRVASERAYFVDAAPLRDAAQVSAEIAAAFGLGDLHGRSLAEALAAELREPVLLVLDNCEHLVGGCADLTDRLLRRCASLRMLVTSQQRLAVPGEAVWALAGLEVPAGAPGADVDLANLLGAPAAQLFCERARAVSRAFAPTAHVGAVVEICRRLEGNPLALALAAARVDVLPPSEIAQRLNERFVLLRGQVGGPARHETLEAALAWSVGLLGDGQRTLLMRLSVFAGGFRLRGVEQVCTDERVTRDEVFDLLAALVAKSLIEADTGCSPARYRMLETVRLYAEARLADSGEAAGVAERHAAFWSAEVDGHTAKDDTGDWLVSDSLARDNLRAAIDWSIAQNRTERAFRLGTAMMQFWEGNGAFSEAHECLSRILALDGEVPVPLRAGTLHDAGFVAFMLGDMAVAIEHLERGLALWTELGDEQGYERTKGLLGVVSTFGGGPTGVGELEERVARLRADGDEHLPEALLACGQARLFQGEPLMARAHFQGLVAAARQRGDETLIGAGLVGSGSAMVLLGEYAAAATTLEDGVGVAATQNEALTVSVGHVWLADLARRRGAPDEARARFEACLEEARRVAAPFPLAKALVGLGLLQAEARHAEPARRLLDEAVDVARESCLRHLISYALAASGEAAIMAGDAAAAGCRFEEALRIAEEGQDKGAIAMATFHLAELARSAGDVAHAASLHHDALTLREETGDRPGLVDSLEALAGVAARSGSFDVAGRLFGATDGFRTAAGWPRLALRQAAYDEDLAVLQAAIDADELERTWAQGAALNECEAVAYARRRRGPRLRPNTGTASLTPSEREIVALVAEGLTNPEIAERLFISPRTVQSHLRNVYAKLEVSSRRELRRSLAAEAAEGA